MPLFFYVGPVEILHSTHYAPKILLPGHIFKSSLNQFKAAPLEHYSGRMRKRVDLEDERESYRRDVCDK